jgi:CBS domain containing-hemolysin-like protein
MAYISLPEKNNADPVQSNTIARLVSALLGRAYYFEFIQAANFYNSASEISFYLSSFFVVSVLHICYGLLTPKNLLIQFAFKI